MSTTTVVTCDGCGQETNGCEGGWIRLRPRCPQAENVPHGMTPPRMLILVERPSHGGATFTASETDRLDYCSVACASRHLSGAPKS